MCSIRTSTITFQLFAPWWSTGIPFKRRCVTQPAWRSTPIVSAPRNLVHNCSLKQIMNGSTFFANLHSCVEKVFYAIFRINNGCILKQYWWDDLCDGEVLCFLWDMDWILRSYLHELWLQRVNENPKRGIIYGPCFTECNCIFHTPSSAWLKFYISVPHTEVVQSCLQICLHCLKGDFSNDSFQTAPLSPPKFSFSAKTHLWSPWRREKMHSNAEKWDGPTGLQI
jgi:hypothetical protein